MPSKPHSTHRIPQQESSAAGRIHAMDSLRAFVMFCVLFTHAVIPYMTIRMPDLRWSIYESQGSGVFDWIFVAVRGFTMPIFFLIAGFWSVYYREKLTATEFIKKRMKRVLIPFIWGLLIVLPITYYVWAFGWMWVGECFLLEIFLWKFSDEIMRNLYGPVHLWFLEYLLLMMILYLILTEIRIRFNAGRLNVGSGLLCGFWAPFILAIPTVLILSCDSGAMWNFHNTILIRPTKFLHYSWFFAVGTIFYLHRDKLNMLAKYAWIYLILVIPCLIGTKVLLFKHISVDQTASFQIGLVNGMFVWLSTYAVAGLAFKYWNKPIFLTRYFADASYWFYLTHFTLIGALQLMLFFTGFHIFVKCLISTVLTVAICTWSYQRFVRYSFIGSTLHKPLPNHQGKIASASPSKKIVVSFAIFYAICALTVYQIQESIWKKEKIRYTRIITEYYWIYLKRAPDQPGLEYWVGRAMDHMGLPLVEKEAFIDEVARDRAKGVYY